MKCAISILAAMTFLAACTPQTRPSTPSANAEPFHILIPLTPADRELFDKDKPEPLRTNSKLKLAEEDIAKSCDLELRPTDPVQNIAPFLAAILGPLVKAGIGLGLDALSDKMKTEIEKHSATYESSAWIDSHSLSKVTCFRFARGVSTQAGDEVHLDMIIGLKREPNVEGVLVHPLRVYFSEPAPKRESADQKYGFAVSFEVTSVSFEERKSTSEVAILKDKFEPPFNDPELKYYVRHYPLRKDKFCDNPIEATKHELRCHPAPAGQYVAIPIAALGSNPVVGIEVKAVETGTPDKYLSALQSLLDSAKKDIGSGLADIANAKLGIKDD